MKVSILQTKSIEQVDNSFYRVLYKDGNTNAYTGGKLTLQGARVKFENHKDAIAILKFEGVEQCHVY